MARTYECEDCGETFETPKARGRLPRRCSWCKQSPSASSAPPGIPDRLRLGVPAGEVRRPSDGEPGPANTPEANRRMVAAMRARAQ